MPLHLKDYLSLANAGCGFLALAFVIPFGYLASVALVVLAVVFDFLDGLAARKKGVQDEFGRQLDSLADAVSFGVVPPALLLISKFGFAFEFVAEETSFKFYATLLGGIFFVSAAVIRLAKFNVQKEKGVYYGLPSPFAALLFLAFGWFSFEVGIFALFALGVLMLYPLNFKKVF
ncbi:MAG: CDP-alcohol phosphatidyltransferase family protein [Candidatus Micrarchaeota archaeon]